MFTTGIHKVAKVTVSERRECNGHAWQNLEIESFDFAAPARFTLHFADAYKAFLILPSDALQKIKEALEVAANIAKNEDLQHDLDTFIAALELIEAAS